MAKFLQSAASPLQTTPTVAQILPLYLASYGQRASSCPLGDSFTIDLPSGA